jgi:hypothetical protein
MAAPVEPTVFHPRTQPNVHFTTGATLNHALRLLVAALIALVATPASAGEFASLKQEIVTARQTLVAMITHRELRGPEQQRLVKETADAVSAHVARIKAPQGRTAEFQELKGTWQAFKATR